MQSASSSSSNAATTINVGISGHERIDFDKRALKRALVKGGNTVAKTARRLVARRAISKPGQFPGRRSGALFRHIGIIKKGSKGGYVKVGVKTITGSVFYPAILFYGSQKRNIRKRANYMVEALNQKRAEVRETIRASLLNALVPR